jgi:peptidoglycan/LPS O-acetylase OafA/YrhL
MWHIIAINVMLFLGFGKVDLSNNVNNFMLHLSSILLTITLSAISYRYCESYFLKLKKCSSSKKVVLADSVIIEQKAA